MQIPGRVHNGVVVFDGEASLPEGTPVTVSPAGVRIWPRPGKKRRVRFPLVRSDHSGTLDLTNDRIAEILEEEDLASVRELVKRTKS